MLKEFVAKFTKCGQGPYVIANLSSSGVVKLSTLDGEEMPNWISGCRMKLYERLVNKKQLDKIH